MLQKMKESVTIEEAMGKIIMNPQFLANFILNLADCGEFAHRLIRNYSFQTVKNRDPLSLQYLETIESLEPKSESHFIMDHLMMHLFPLLLTNHDLRNEYLTISLIHDFDWLAPIVVLMDYFTYYLDTDGDKREAFMSFILWVAASMDSKKLAKTVKGSIFGEI